MLRVKDDSGNIVPGLLKDSAGSLIVRRDADYERYIKEKQQQEKIENLSNTVDELKSLVTALISTINNNGSK